jgi:hypothetical protein
MTAPPLAATGPKTSLRSPAKGIFQGCFCAHEKAGHERQESTLKAYKKIELILIRL